METLMDAHMPSQGIASDPSHIYLDQLWPAVCRQSLNWKKDSGGLGIPSLFPIPPESGELPWDKNSSLPFPGTLCVWILSLFLSCELVPLYLFFNFSYKEHQRLSSSSVWLISLSVQSFKIHPPRNQWHNYLILVALFFHSARLSDGPLSICNTSSLTFNLSVGILKALFWLLQVELQGILGYMCFYWMTTFSGYQPRCRDIWS